MKKIISLLLVLLMTFSLVACSEDTPADQPVDTTPTMSDLDFSSEDPAYFAETALVTDYVKLTVSYADANDMRQTGEIIIRLFANVAPTTVQNFQNMVSRGVYNGSTFHSVIEDFMIQGGSTKETVSPIKGEFTENGFTNNLQHVRGVVSMARTTLPDSASSQFFIMHKTTPELDGKYASFGFVVSGMETVDDIANTRVMFNTNSGDFETPAHTVLITKASFVEKTDTPQTPSDGVSMETLDFSAIDINKVIETDNVTDLVKMSITYTDENGNHQEGDIVIRLFAEVAPITVENFQTLVKQKSYDGTLFHRIRKDFMIQGGAMNLEIPSIKGEFTNNGVPNPLQHVRGVVSMARSNDPNSADSQFFIMHKTTASLNDRYASFGYVVYGMETVDEIAKTEVRLNVAGELSDPINLVTITKTAFVRLPSVPVDTPSKDAVSMDDLDFSDIDLDKMSETDTVTDLVKLTVEFTDESGSLQTGDVVIRLFAEVAPITVQNFQTLVAQGSYNGSVFHRVYKNFMIQGGAVDSEIPPIKGEFIDNGVINNLQHIRGVVSMTRTGNLDSATSQFFIMHRDNFSLNGYYAAFGYVVSGMDVVDAIANTEVQANPDFNGELSAPVNSVTITNACFLQKDSTPVKGPVFMDDLDFSDLDITTVTETEEVTDLVKLTIEYTDANGALQTGDVVIRLFSEVAPITVQNFQTLVAQGSYNGTVFNRVVKDFMIQSGAVEPDTTPIKGEFSDNGVTNNLKHIRGVVSMVRGQALDSATSAFFIMHQTNDALDNQYASFGYVVCGMDTVDAITNTPVEANPDVSDELSSPVSPVTIVNACFVNVI